MLVVPLVEPGKTQDVIAGLQKSLPNMDYLSLKVDQSGSKVFSMSGIE